jgi:hypothetical protein
LVERFFNKIKQCCRIATRYDKLAANYLAFIELACIRIWLRCMSPRPSYGITASGDNDRLSTLWREVISLAGVARALSTSKVQSIS